MPAESDLATLAAELNFRLEITHKLRDLAHLAIATLKRHLECGDPVVEEAASSALRSIGEAGKSKPKLRKPKPRA
jgi:hypothetical protein